MTMLSEYQRGFMEGCRIGNLIKDYGSGSVDEGVLSVPRSYRGRMRYLAGYAAGMKHIANEMLCVVIAAQQNERELPS
jgi:hypothetical protein